MVNTKQGVPPDCQPARTCAALTACDCGYPDRRFCPAHGDGLRTIAAVAAEHGAIAGEAFVDAFEDGALPCPGCVLGMGDHDPDVCEGRPAADTPARRAFMVFMWRQPGPDAADVRRWALAGDPEIRGWVANAARAIANVARLQRDEDEERRLLDEFALFEGYLKELPR
jgi:hypothetical protein